ncbi:hypothetical protein CVU82_03460 [Candidatus Falkowbacteria bacterium HGW-Falkowbacteria-1]|uniref:Uncharacterized protein n=1 Tax=Candidatus Falkowbacteria bacterium HGW-Falkowbacteria-1 TaxID=2013768 RepID=A0A2N2E8N9_9BACT|nr:MAG: hypothetical protein CVU82_03460 [Candidatus Falkowbacteria bacterium HGW-Falkowbacteria-1]
MKFFTKNKKIFISLAPILLVGIIFLFPNLVHAGVGETIATVLGWVLYPIIWILGKILLVLMNVLIGIAQYNSFIDSNAVKIGWALVRDLCNMFFILILLIIAFATILRVEQYNLKTWLPKLLLMAVLINFSKLICGAFIDVAQIVMLTFVNAFKDMAGGNLTEMLGVTKILSFDQGSSEDVTGWTILGSIILALIFSIISVVVILTMLVMLAMRIIMIWIYVVLSPLAYLLASFPQGQSYSQRWWSDFSKNLIVGPVLAFFIWLSFASLGGVEGSSDIVKMKRDNPGGEEVAGGSDSATITEAGSSENITKFIISIGMLLGGLMIAQEMGGAAGKIAGKGMASLQKMGDGAIKGAKRASGVERAENAIKAYKQQKETKRSELAQRDAGSLMKMEGKLKKGVAKPFQQAGGFVGNQLKAIGGLSDKQIKRKEDVIKNKVGEKEALSARREELAKFDIDGEIKVVDGLKTKQQENRKEFERKLEREKDPKQISLLQADAKRTDKEYSQKIQEKEKSIINTYGEVTGEKVSNIDEVRTGKDKFKSEREGAVMAKTKEIKSKSEEIELGQKEIAKKRKRSEQVGKWGTVAAGAMTGALLGGGIPGAIIGGVAGATGRHKLKHAGEGALDIASNHNSSQIGKYKEKMKDEREEDIRKKMNDYSLTGHERTAATMTLMERGELSQEEASVKSSEIRDSYKHDGKVKNQLDGVLNNNYQNLTQSFTELHSTAGGDSRSQDTKDKHEKVQKKIVSGVVNGTIKIANIDDQESLNLIMPELSKTMTDKNFKGVYDGQTTEKRAQLKVALKASGTPNARTKLAAINNDLSPLEGTNEKAQYLEKANLNQMQDLTSSIDGLKSLKQFFQESGSLSKYRDLVNAGKNEEFRAEMNMITKNMQFNTSNAHKAMLDSIAQSIKS